MSSRPGKEVDRCYRLSGFRSEMMVVMVAVGTGDEETQSAVTRVQNRSVVGRLGNHRDEVCDEVRG